MHVQAANIKLIPYVSAEKLVVSRYFPKNEDESTSLSIPLLNICNIWELTGRLWKRTIHALVFEKIDPWLFSQRSKLPPSSLLILTPKPGPSDNQGKLSLQSGATCDFIKTLPWCLCLYRKPLSRALRWLCNHFWLYHPPCLSRNRVGWVSRDLIQGYRANLLEL